MEIEHKENINPDSTSTSCDNSTNNTGKCENDNNKSTNIKNNNNMKGEQRPLLPLSNEDTTQELPRQLDDEILPEEANRLLLWMARFPVQRIHPRPTTTLSTLWKSQDVMISHTSDKIIDVFRKLIIEGFLSCPVIDENNQYHAFIDMLALANFTLQLFSNWKLSNTNQQQQSTSASASGSGSETDPNKVAKTSSDSSNISSLSMGDSTDKFWQLPEYRDTMVSQIMDKGSIRSRNPFFPVFRGFSLLHCVELMARLGCHRVPVLCPRDKKVVGIITQSMVISLLDQELPNFGPLKDIPVKEMIPGLTTHMVSVQASTVAEEAFKMMVDLNVSGLPVVNESGILIDTISVRDLRGVGPGPGAGSLHLLYQPVSSFKLECRKLFPSQTPDKPIFVTIEDSFEKLIRSMHDGNIHRVFVCMLDSQNQPIPHAVITQRDVLRFFIYRLGMAPALIPLSAV